MKWREPKIKGMLTGANIVALFFGLLIAAVPITYLCTSTKKFSFHNFLIVVGYMMILGVVIVIAPLLGWGSQIQLRGDAIIRSNGKYGKRTAYKDIECIYLYRDCFYSWVDGVLVTNVQQRNAEDPKFARFEIELKDKSPLARVISSPLQSFTVPESVNLESVLQILREKGVKIVEGPVLS